MIQLPRPFILVVIGLSACSGKGGENILPLPASPSAVASAASAPALVLPLEVNLQAAETFVRIGYGLEPGGHFQADSFLTTRLRTVQAQHLVRLVKTYNNFNGERVAEALGRFRGQLSAVEFGRDGSPLLYLELPHWTHQREETVPAGMGTKIPESEHQALVAKLRQVFVAELQADEFSEKGRRVRIWWN